MGRSTRFVQKERMSQSRLNSMITNPAPDFYEKEHVEPKPILTGCEEYDTLKPEETISQFCSNIREILSQYAYDKEHLVETENKMQDLLHYIELTGDKNANAGFKLYKQLTLIRRERRRCKNEIDLLQPVYDVFHDTGLLSKLTELQGKCRGAKQQIDARGYSIRTDVLDEFM